MSPRGRLPSRPDPRVDEITPVVPVVHQRPGSHADPPWWADVLRDELRDLRLRLGAHEERVDALEDAAEVTKTRHVEGEKKAEKWGARAWDGFKTVVLALTILVLGGVLQKVSCTPPAVPPTSPAIERKP